MKASTSTCLYGFISSNSIGTTFGVQPRVAKIYKSGSATATSGVVDASQNTGQIVSVFEFE